MQMPLSLIMCRLYVALRRKNHVLYVSRRLPMAIVRRRRVAHIVRISAICSIYHVRLKAGR